MGNNIVCLAKKNPNEMKPLVVWNGVRVSVVSVIWLLNAEQMGECGSVQ